MNREKSPEEKRKEELSKNRLCDILVGIVGEKKAINDYDYKDEEYSSLKRILLQKRSYDLSVEVFGKEYARSCEYLKVSDLDWFSTEIIIKGKIELTTKTLLQDFPPSDREEIISTVLNYQNNPDAWKLVFGYVLAFYLNKDDEEAKKVYEIFSRDIYLRAAKMLEGEEIKHTLNAMFAVEYCIKDKEAVSKIFGIGCEYNGEALGNIMSETIGKTRFGEKPPEKLDASFIKRAMAALDQDLVKNVANKYSDREIGQQGRVVLYALVETAYCRKTKNKKIIKKTVRNVAKLEEKYEKNPIVLESFMETISEAANTKDANFVNGIVRILDQDLIYEVTERFRGKDLEKCVISTIKGTIHNLQRMSNPGDMHVLHTGGASMHVLHNRKTDVYRTIEPIKRIVNKIAKTAIEKEDNPTALETSMREIGGCIDNAQNFLSHWDVASITAAETVANYKDTPEALEILMEICKRFSTGKYTGTIIKALVDEVTKSSKKAK